MGGATVTEFMAYWEAEGQAYVRRGDYDWMASLIPGQRVLEIGCGIGYSTRAILARGLSVLALDSLQACLDATWSRAHSDKLELMLAELEALASEQRAAIAAFAPDVVLCWLMGAPASTTGASGADGGKAVVAYRERIHRAAAELAAELPSVRALHLVDRTAIAWQAKDIGRETLVKYHLGKTLLDLPLTAERRYALFRKLDNVTEIIPNRKTHPAIKSVVPTLASLLVERK